MKVFITGDTHEQHSRFNKIKKFCKEHNTTKNDIMIILGDVGFNYYINSWDDSLKRFAQELPITFFCIRGNHEQRPEKISRYVEKTFLNNSVLYQEEYPDLIFSKDGNVYTLNDKKYLVLGGAYSVDKYYRLATCNQWFESEQLSLQEQNEIYKNLENLTFDAVLSHTCPYSYIPTECFISRINQLTVDNGMEKFLDAVLNEFSFNKDWYCGHWHINKKVDNIQFLFEDILEIM